MSNPSKDQAHTCLDNNEFKTNLKTNNVKFAAIPNQLVDAWLAGNISDPCFKLVTICLRHAESFHIKHNYLTKFCKMNGNTVKKAQNEAVERNILEITKKRVNRSFENHYRVKDISEWNLEALHTLTSELVNFTSSHLNDSELNDSLLNDSLLHYLKNTNSKNPNLKKTEKKNTNDDEGKIQTSSLGKTFWLSKRKPSEVINDCLDLKLIPARKNGYVHGIVEWNEIAFEVWKGKTDQEITEDLLRLREWPHKLPKSAERILNLLSELKTPEPKFEANNAFESDAEYQNYLLTVKDDMPF